jgi:cell division protein FtsB
LLTSDEDGCSARAVASTLFPTVIPAVLRRPASAIAALLLAALLGSSLLGSGGLVHLRRLRAERAALGEDAFRLLAKNDALRQKILHLRRSDRALERLARQELGLVRDGEIVYRFRPRPP